MKEIPFASLTNAIDVKIEKVLTGFLIGWNRVKIERVLTGFLIGWSYLIQNFCHITYNSCVVRKKNSFNYKHLGFFLSLYTCIYICLWGAIENNIFHYFYVCPLFIRHRIQLFNSLRKFRCFKFGYIIERLTNPYCRGEYWDIRCCSPFHYW